ncbi:MAG: glutaredoxin family protein [Candidatus Electrothrix sp. ATG1]|nr:glutaredoxin family protein [Candidatus Electrothrix sp. ATG1]
MKKIAVVALLSIITLWSVSQGDIRTWFDGKSDYTISLLKRAVGRSDEPDKKNDIIYKWTDENGVRHFSNTRPSGVDEVETVPAKEYTVPSISLQEKEEKTFSSITNSPSKTVSKQNKRKKKKRPTKKRTDKVMIFTANQCGYCKQAVTFLRSHGIGFKEYNIDRDKGAKEKMRAAGGVQHVPFAVINGKKLRGFSEGNYRRALNLSAASSITGYKKRIRSTRRT